MVDKAVGARRVYQLHPEGFDSLREYFEQFWSLAPSEVEVTFTPVDNGTTRVDLEHRHFERHGEGWETMRTSIDSLGGWGGLLAFYQRKAED